MAISAEVGQGDREAGPSILLAEDDTAVRSLLARVLRASGYEVVEAGDGAAAQALVEAAPFDLLVTDVLMPRLSGLDLVSRLRAAGRTLPVIFITGYADALIDAAEAEFVLRKPFSPGALAEAVRRALAQA